MLEFLYEALNSPIGRAVKIDEPSDMERFRQKLYGLRKQDPALECLSFVISPIDPCELWIIKKGEPPDASR